MAITGSQARKIVALAVGLYVGLDLFPEAWALADLLSDARASARAEAIASVVMALLSILGAALVFGQSRNAALLFGAAAVTGIYLGNTSALTNLDMWGFLLLVPAGLAVLAAWEESQEDESEDVDE